MAKFEAAGIVEDLEYDFRPYIDVHGTVEEPNDKRLIAFANAWRQELINSATEIGADQAELEKMSRAEILKTLESVDPAKTEATISRQADLYSALCNGSPTAAQLRKLPPRVRVRFYRWLDSELMNPEADAGAGNGQVVPIRPSAAG